MKIRVFLFLCCSLAGVVAAEGCSNDEEATDDDETTVGPTTASSTSVSTSVSTTASTSASTSASTGAGGIGTGGMSGMCSCADLSDPAIAGTDCPDLDLTQCVCDACDTDMTCDLTEDCVCPDCAADAFCSDPANCDGDGLCNAYLEGCGCADCADHPTCPGGAATCEGMGTGGAGGAGGGTTSAGGAGGAGGAGTGGAGPCACDAALIMGCTDENTSLCICEACDPGGGCTFDEDCVCPDCANDTFCGDPTNCNNNGLCDPYSEGCVCADCADHPSCPGGSQTCPI